MRLSSVLAIAAPFVAAAILSWVVAGHAVTVIEENSRLSVRGNLHNAELDWAEVDTDGLQIYLAGTAPSEAARFKALSATGEIVDAARVIDQMLVEESDGIAPPRFSVEILRNDSGISVIGLIPADADREVLTEAIATAADGADVTDLLEVADYPPREGWNEALDFGVEALELLTRTKISLDADRVEVRAMAESQAGKREIESELTRLAPSELALSIDISAPRPVITPFTLRFLIQDGTARFDACSADTQKARARILAAAARAGLDGAPDCTIGLGVPSPRWAEAAELAIGALADIGQGSVTMTDADISIVTTAEPPRTLFDDTVGSLESDLPEVFALHAVRPEQTQDDLPDATEFVATLSPEGLVQIRGRVGSKRLRDTVDSFARARFTSDAVYTKARVVEGLPASWSLRVLTGLEALRFLSNGVVRVTPDTFDLTGSTGEPEARARISALLSEKLGRGAQFDIDVSYRERLDPVASKPTPEECVARIAEVQDGRKISFKPGSDTIGGAAADVMDKIAEILKECGSIRMEIAGHTDSQGREIMNERLSQSRARSVLNALRARRVLTSSFVAKGYGESDPIADNDTEEGREANRRIEFSLIRPEEKTAGDAPLEEDISEENQADETAATEAPDGGSGDDEQD